MKRSRYAALLAALAGAAAPAAGPLGHPASSEPRVPVATVVSDVGVLASEGAGDPFRRILARGQVHSRDLLVVAPGLRASLESRSRGARLTLWGNLPQLSDSPVLESVAVLHDTGTYDLDLTPVRGRVVLRNTKKKGAARVWVRGRGAGVLLTLPEPGDRAAIEVFARWPPGVAFSPKQPAAAGPIQAWEVLVLRGRLEITTSKARFALSAPPGAASFRGDSVAGPDERGPRRLARLPAWADPKATLSPDAARIRGLLESYQKHATSGGLREALAEVLALAEKDTDRRRAALARHLVVYARAATDDIAEVIESLADPRHPEAREAAVVALRHWASAAAGRDQALHQALLDEGYAKAEAETVLELLRSPFDPEQPETYETLIAYLAHRRLAARVLAHWHLARMAPAGRELGFDPAGVAAARAKAVAGWKKLIPAGALPPEPKEKPDAQR